MNELNVLAQVAGALGLGGLIASYLQKSKNNFLFLQIFCNISSAIQYALLGGWTTVMMCFIAIARSVLYRFLNNKSDEIPLFALVLNEVAIAICGILTYTGPMSLLAILNSGIFAYGVWQKNLKKTYLIGASVAISWAVYNFLIGAYVGIIASIFEATSGLIGFYRLYQLQKRTKDR